MDAPNEKSPTLADRLRKVTPAQTLAATFLLLIVAGTALLRLPIAAEGAPLSLMDAFFTATSAICVTGLIVVDTPNAFSFFGELVVMLLIQLGGLGYMTFSTVLAIALGKRLTISERATLQEALNLQSAEGLVGFLGTVLKTILVFEISGAVILTLYWWKDFGFLQAAWLGTFHAVSAFNNAGFSLFSDNLVRFRGDLVVNVVITTLIICGGVGFFVLRDVGQWRRTGKLAVHSKFALLLTGSLLAIGTLMFLVLEWRNEATLGPLGVGEKMMAAYFAAVTPRTAGFNTISVGDMTVPALFLTIVLMFIGASPGGTGGGVKTTTFGITVLALWATVRDETEPVLYKRRIGADVVMRAFFISLIAFLAVNVIAGAILVAEQKDLLKTLFETTSAFGTVGLSMGEPGSVLSLAGHFSSSGRLLLILMMFIGRVGPLTLAIALAGRRTRSLVRYPEGRVLIG